MTAEACLDDGGARETGDLTTAHAARDFTVAQDARRDERGLTTTRNPGDVGLENLPPRRRARCV